MASLQTLTINDTGFIKLPLGTIAQRPSPGTAMTRWNSDKGTYEAYDGSNWINADNRYETLNLVATGPGAAFIGGGTDCATLYRTGSTSGWDAQVYSTNGWTAPVTLEFYKNAGAGGVNNGFAYAMISLNTDPTTDASYGSLDHAAFPYFTKSYSVFHNGTQMLYSGRWSASQKFYIVYGTDGYIRHYNGSTQLYSVSVGTGNTYYLDSCMYFASYFSTFYDVRVIKKAWNGTKYVG